MMVSSLDEIAWLLNVRGGDIAFCPVTLAFAVVEKDKATGFRRNGRSRRREEAITIGSLFRVSA